VLNFVFIEAWGEFLHFKVAIVQPVADVETTTSCNIASFKFRMCRHALTSVCRDLH